MSNLIIYIKYIVAIILVAIVICAPAYLARQTGRDKTDMAKIRIGSWVLGWSIVAWIWALFKASKK